MTIVNFLLALNLLSGLESAALGNETNTQAKARSLAGVM